MLAFLLRLLAEGLNSGYKYLHVGACGQTAVMGGKGKAAFRHDVAFANKQVPNLKRGRQGDVARHGIFAKDPPLIKGQFDVE